MQTINDLVAMKVMGWTLKSFWQAGSYVDAWVDSSGEITAWYGEWHPSSESYLLPIVEERLRELGNDKQMKYVSCLMEIVGFSTKGSSLYNWWSLVTATPMQKCLAALRAVDPDFILEGENDVTIKSK